MFPAKAKCRLCGPLVPSAGLRPAMPQAAKPSAQQAYIPPELIEFVEGLSEETFRDFPCAHDNAFKMTPSQVKHWAMGVSVSLRTVTEGGTAVQRWHLWNGLLLYSVRRLLH